MVNKMSKEISKEISKHLAKCPFCGGEAIYETKRENELGTIIPQLFCNDCKMIFEIENDSPYLNDDKTHDYLKEKLYVWWNTRTPMERIVKRLEEAKFPQKFGGKTEMMILADKAIEIVKEEGGMNE